MATWCLLLFGFVVLGEAQAIDPATVAKAKVGALLFQRVWQPGQPASPGGDGLGPVHNDVSCVACHHQGAVGGGGGVEKNATLLSLSPKPAGMSQRIFHKRAAQLHPALMTEVGGLKETLVLHKFSTDPKYNASRQMFVGIEMPLVVSDDRRTVAEKLVADHPVRDIPHAAGIRFKLSQRNSPALFGAGLIDAIPDDLLRKVEKQQAQRGLVSGRVSPVNGRVGKFGWKGQTASLRDFVRDACANELGLQVPGRDQAVHPMHLDYKPTGLDLNAVQLESLTTFVALLPRPVVSPPDDKTRARLASHGGTVFQRAGCAECHVPTLTSSSGTLTGVFSDLLLHDMGPNLSDPVLANPVTVTISVDVPSQVANQSSGSPAVPILPTSSSSGSGGGGGGGSYGGGGGGTSGGSSSSITTGSRPGKSRGVRTIDMHRTVATNRSSEWRTPPLWGVSQSAPYLHDGRASTLTSAILYHGGEAKFSVKRFLTLTPQDRLALLAFLETLDAPTNIL